jgi:mannonate dehydratase
MHLSAAVTNQGVAEQPQRPGSTLTDVFPLQVDWQDGYLVPSERPGLGIEFDEAAARANPYRGPGPGRMLRRDDGSITNW